MNKLNLVLKLLIVLVFALFFSIIGVTKKTIDSYNDKDALEDNIDNLRGILWANYTFITLSLAIGLTIIIVKKYYQKYKWTVIFTIFFILLNTGMNIFEELTIKEYETVEISQLNNVYIISSIMNIIYFILFIRLIKIVDDITQPQEYSSSEVEQNIRNGPYNRMKGRGYVPFYGDDEDNDEYNGNSNGNGNGEYNGEDYDEEPSYFEGAYGGRYGHHTLDHLRKTPILDNDAEITSDDVEFDEELGITFKPSKRRRTPSF